MNDRYLSWIDNGSIGAFWDFFKILLYLHYISGENGVLQVLFVIVGVDVLKDKRKALRPYSRNRVSSRLSSMVFRLHVWAHTKNK